MADFTEKVEALETRLDKLSNVFDHIHKSLTTEHQSAHSETLGGRPDWVEEIVQHFNGISAELKSVKKTLERHPFTDNGDSPSDGSVANAGAEAEAELRRDAPLLHRPERERVYSASLGSGRRESVPVGAREPAPHAQNSPNQVSLMSSNSREPANHATQPNRVMIDPRLDGPRDRDTPMFSCHYSDISKTLNEEKLMMFSSDPRVKRKGYFKLAVEGLPPLNVDEASFAQPRKDHCTNFSSRPDSQGGVKVTKKENREVKIPKFPLPESQRDFWQRGSLKECWEGALKEPPQDMLYVIGEPLFPDIELSPGGGLTRIDGYKNLRGIGTTYVYLSIGVSFSVMHMEDAKFRPLNVLRSGECKLWLVVEPAYEKELERHMRQASPKMAKCSQALRRLSRVISPRRLDEWKIPYSLDYCKPGEAIVTEPGAIHQVLNIGSNYAFAVNILYGSLSTIPQSYKFCQKSCDPNAITATHLQTRQEGSLDEFQANQRDCLPLDKATTV